MAPHNTRGRSRYTGPPAKAVSYTHLDVYKRQIYASGYLQPVKKYGADYFYNEHDGMAHRTWIDSENSDVLQMCIRDRT